MPLPNCGTHPRFLENLRIGGGYASLPDGGADLDHAGNAAFDGDLTVGGAIDYRGILRANVANGGVNRDWSTAVPLFGDEASATAAGPATVSFSTRMHYKAWDFSPATLQALNVSFMLPHDYDGAPLRVRLVWTSQASKGGTAGNVRWRCYMRAYNDAAPYSISLAFVDVTAAFHGVDKFHLTDIVHTPENPGKGLPVSLNLRRAADDPADTFDADAQLLKVLISYA